LLLDRYAEAQEAIFTALKADSGNPLILYDAARILLTNGNVEDALSALQASLEIEPNQAEAHELMNWLAHLTTPKDGAAHEP
jgi:tetratricopeptide (TPR) repeat protein